MIRTILLLLLAAASPRGELVDRVVASVDDDPIFMSDVERVIRLGLTAQEEGESPSELRRRVLDEIIDQRLRLHEVERFDTSAVSAEEVDRQVAIVKDRFEDDAEFRSILDRLSLDEAGLRHLLTRQLRVLAYIEERLRPRVYVDLDDIRSYYDGELAAEMARRGETATPLSAVREDIRFLLTEKRLNEEIEAWTEELRLAADVVDYLGRGEEELPPVVRRIDG